MQNSEDTQLSVISGEITEPVITWDERSTATVEEVTVMKTWKKTSDNPEKTHDIQVSVA